MEGLPPTPSFARIPPGQCSDFSQRTEGAAFNCKSAILQRFEDASTQQALFGTIVHNEFRMESRRALQPKYRNFGFPNHGIIIKKRDTLPEPNRAWGRTDQFLLS
jgi:hypothetical protein